MRAKMTKLINKTPKWGWQNTGGDIPYRLRGKVRRESAASRHLVLDGRGRIPRYHWVVIGFSGEMFIFSPEQMKNLYYIDPWIDA